MTDIENAELGSFNGASGNASSQVRFLVVGGGKMGAAIMAGLIDAQLPAAQQITAKDFVVVNPGEERRAFLQETYGVCCLTDVSEFGGFADAFDGAGGVGAPGGAAAAVNRAPVDIVLLAVKPQVLGSVLDEMAQLPAFQGGESGPLFVSIAAGVTTSSLAEALPKGSRIVRVMPNMPLMVGAGASGMCATSNAQEDLQLVKDLFDCLGVAVVVDEQQMDAVCALSGSGPAYVAKMIEELVDASVQQGLPQNLAEQLAVQTVLGTAQLIEQSDLSPAQLREAVSSPGGTTLAALEAMESHGFGRALEAGVDAAVKRSKELAG